MRENILGLMLIIMITSTLFHPLLATKAANDGVNSDEIFVVNKVRSVITDSIGVTDNAIDILS